MFHSNFFDSLIQHPEKNLGEHRWFSPGIHHPTAHPRPSTKNTHVWCTSGRKISWWIRLDWFFHGFPLSPQQTCFKPRFPNMFSNTFHFTSTTKIRACLPIFVDSSHFESTSTSEVQGTNHSCWPLQQLQVLDLWYYRWPQSSLLYLGSRPTKRARGKGGRYPWRVRGEGHNGLYIIPTWLGNIIL